MTRDMTWCTSVHMLMLLILGMADTAYFLNDILDPKSARFPAFELWCTPAWYCYVWGMRWLAMYRWVYYCYVFWSGTGTLFVTAMSWDRLLVAPLQSSNYIGVFILFSILCFFLNCKDSIFQFCFQLRICSVWQSYIYHSIQNLHVYRVLIVLLFVNWGCRGFFDVSLLTFTVITIESQYFFNP